MASHVTLDSGSRSQIHCTQLMPRCCDMRSGLRYGPPARGMGSGRVCPGSFSPQRQKTSKQTSHVLETQRLALQVEKGKDATEACDERSKDQQASGEGRRAKNHKVRVAYAAGLTVCYPDM